MLTFWIIYAYLDRTLKKILVHRWDGSPALPYYSASDFNLIESQFCFYSGKWKLYGSRYLMKGCNPKAVIIFFHGIGAGRNAYLKFIAKLAKEGYLVYAFDNTGSMTSEGTSVIGFGQVVRDQKHFFDFLDRDPQAKNLPRYVVGHSWGGYAALMALNPLYKVDKCVSLSGFDRVSSTFMALTKHEKNRIIRTIFKIYCYNKLGANGDRSALKLLKTTKIPVLYIQGSEDKVVPVHVSGDVFKKELKDHKNVHFIDVIGQGHQPFLTPEAEKYLNSLVDGGIEDVNSTLKMDIEKASAENNKVFEAIFDFLAH
jgi:pimeloyl-ACP methyl ester carboxylesterase